MSEAGGRISPHLRGPIGAYGNRDHCVHSDSDKRPMIGSLLSCFVKLSWRSEARPLLPLKNRLFFSSVLTSALSSTLFLYKKTKPWTTFNFSRV